MRRVSSSERAWRRLSRKRVALELVYAAQGHELPRRCTGRAASTGQLARVGGAILVESQAHEDVGRNRRAPRRIERGAQGARLVEVGGIRRACDVLGQI